MPPRGGGDADWQAHGGVVDSMLVLTGGLGELMFNGVHIVGVLVVIYGLVYAVAI